MNKQIVNDEELLDFEDDMQYLKIKQRTTEKSVEKRDRIAQSRKNIKKGNRQ